MSSNKKFGKRIPLTEVKSATDNFSEKNLIRRGGFGKIYKGKLVQSSGEAIDIVARRLDPEYRQGQKEFLMELRLLSALEHENVVSIIGYCDEKGEKIIINKLEAHGSLDEHLTDKSLTWMRRLEICVGVAEALKYIHYDKGRDFSVIHRNIKSSKILLDDEWKPKLSGFELSMKNTSARRHRLLLDRLSGTIGYIDPRYEKTGGVTHKSDVYAFGVVLFEVLCGRRAFNNPEWFTTRLDKQDLKEKSPDHVVGNLDKMVVHEERSAGLANQGLTEGSLDVDGNAVVIVGQKGLFPSNMLPHMEQSPPNLSAKNSSAGIPSPSSNNFSVASRTTSYSNLAGENLSYISAPSITHFPDSYAGYRDRSNNLLETARPPPADYFEDDSLERNFSGRFQPSSTRKLSLQSGTLSLGQQSLSSDTLSLGQQSLSSDSTQAPASSIVIGREEESNVYTQQRPPLNPQDMCMFTLGASARFLFENKLGNMCIPEEELLASLAKSHYEEKKLNDLIDPQLREKMDPQSFDIFAKTAYDCLNEQRWERPHIDQVVIRLQEALDLQWKHEYPMISKEHSEVKDFSTNHLKWKIFEHLKIGFHDIKLATNNFSETKCIGKGGYGKVYEAKLEHFDSKNSLDIEGKNIHDLPKICSTVAIKSLIKRNDTLAEEGFLAEIKTLTSCKHPNIVSLLGFCDEEGSDLILVYEYVINGSIDNYIRKSEMTKLKWEQRLQICLEISQGLNYLHTKHNIIHRDIKSDNILLDDNLVAKIADFGLSKIIPMSQKASFIKTNVAGTIVYLDPEYSDTCHLKKPQISIPWE